MRILAALCAVLMVAALLLLPLPSSWRTGWFARCLTLGHVPLFAVLTGGLWLARPRSLMGPAVFALLIGAATEFGQELLHGIMGRSGKVSDFLLDAVGVVSAVVCIRAVQGPLVPARLAGYAFLLLILWAWPITEGLGYHLPNEALFKYLRF